MAQVYITTKEGTYPPPPFQSGDGDPFAAFPDQPPGAPQATSSAAPPQATPMAPGAPEQQADPYSAFPDAPPAKPAYREVGSGEAAMRGGLDAMSFGFYPAMAGAASGVSAVMQGKDFGPAYEQTRADEQAQQQQASQQHPYIYGASEIAGALPTVLIPGLGAEAIGAKAAGTFGRVVNSMRSGALAGGAFGAGQATSEGGSLPDVAKGAAGGAVTGGILGGALGGAIETGAGIGNRVMGIVRGAKNTDAEAGSRVVSALRADKQQVAKNIADRRALTAGNEAGTPLTVADVGGENTKALLRSAANISPSARQIINDAVQNRYAQQSERFSTWIRSKFGGGDKAADIEAIRGLARKENAPAYQRAYASGDRNIWTPELERLTSAPYVQAALGKAISKWKNYAVRDGFGAANPPFKIENGGLIRIGGSGLKAFPNIQLWDYAARELQDRARNAPIGSETAKLYNDLARLLKNELDKEVPAYKAAREGAAAFFGAQNAEEAGAKFVSDNTMHNAEASRIVAKMKPAERALFMRGFAAELAERIERTGFRSDVLNSMFVSSRRAAERIRIALGEEGAAQFEGLMRIEGLVDRTRQALGNSNTIRQGHEVGLAAAGTAGVLESVHATINPVYIIAGGLVLGGRAAAKHIDDKLAVRIAQMLTSDNPAELQRGYKIISNDPTIRTAMRRASDVTGRQIINYLRPSGAAAAGLTLLKHPFGGDEGMPSHPNHVDNGYGNGGGDYGAAPQ